ncbi:MAG: hypothetical protein ABIJ92_04975 [Candidatus Aenigmatarchaeota archaeon]
MSGPATEIVVNKTGVYRVLRNIGAIPALAVSGITVRGRPGQYGVLVNGRNLDDGPLSVELGVYTTPSAVAKAIDDISPGSSFLLSETSLPITFDGDFDPAAVKDAIRRRGSSYFKIDGNGRGEYGSI